MKTHAKLGQVIAVILYCSIGIQAQEVPFTITEITRQNDCTTLTWTSRPGEFYTVYWTDVLQPHVFWRIAEVNVPSGGTNTFWTDCPGESSAMMGGGSSSTTSTTSSEFKSQLSEEELAALAETMAKKNKESVEFLEEKLQESEWYIIQTIESYNGQVDQTQPQGNFIEWFSSNAFGGSNYSKTPIGAITHLEEPFTDLVNRSDVYFRLWVSRKSFPICA